MVRINGGISIKIKNEVSMDSINNLIKSIDSAVETLKSLKDSLENTDKMTVSDWYRESMFVESEVIELSESINKFRLKLENGEE